MKKYFLGIDGGGTKTAICLIDENKKQVGYAVSGPASFDTVSQEEFKNNVINCIQQITLDGEIVSCFAGIGGVLTEDDKNKVISTLSSIKELEKSIIQVDNDVVNALLGGLGTDQGMTCIIGTGSVCYGSNNGLKHRCGGYCWQEGDLGSSYDLGRKALQYLAKVMDGRLVPTVFSQDIIQQTGCSDYSSLANFFIKATRTQIASLAKIVTKNSDDDMAKQIIQSAVDEIMLMIHTVYTKLNFEKTNLAITGSLGNANTYYKDYFQAKMQVELPSIQVVKGKYEAYYGSALKALINYNL